MGSSADRAAGLDPTAVLAPPDGPVHVLLVEDDEDDYVLTRDLLDEVKGHEFRLDWVRDYEAGLEALREGKYDVYLVDYRLGARDGVEFIREATALDCPAAAIMLTGQGQTETDLEALRAGAADYLDKAHLDAPSLVRAIRYALQHRRYVEALRREHEELEQRVRERTAELARVNDALLEADRRKDEFLAMLAHELRNPLAPIRNALQILKLRGVDGADLARPTWEIIDRQVRHLVRLVDDLLDVSRITRGKINLRKERVSLASVLASAVEASRPLVDARGHDLVVALPNRPVILEADPTRLAQVFLNLLNNAAKYTEERGRIQLTAELQGGGGSSTAVVRVRDSGVGIPPDVLPRVFDLFAQADTSLDRAQGGLGIGLTLVRKLVEMHGGTVEADSAGPGQGSEFTVRLPAVPGEKAPTTRSPSRADPRTGEARRRVLIVDDNRDAADSLALLLELNGHKVRTAYDGPASLEAAREFRPGVVLLDIGLPRMNGYEVARRLRLEHAADNLLLVAMTGYGQEEDRRRSKESGFDAHLVKPVDPEMLRDLLRQPSG